MKMRRFGTLLFALLSLTAQGETLVTPATFAGELEAMCSRLFVPAKKTFRIRSSGVDREFIVQSPKRGCSAPQPMVLVFHGGGGTASETESVSPFAGVAKPEAMLVVYPDGLAKNWNDGRVNPEGEMISEAEDVQFVRDMLDLFAGTNKVDMRRVYATGHSNGGTFSLRLACEMADRFAAFVTNAASLALALKDSCHPARPVNLLMVNGVDDTYMPWQGGIGTNPTAGGLNLGARLPVEETFLLFRSESGCPPGGSAGSIPDRDRLSGALAQLRCNAGASAGERARLHQGNVWRSYECQGGSRVELIAVEGGGHTWPSNLGSCFPILKTGNLTVDFDLSEVAMDFFKRHRLP